MLSADNPRFVPLYIHLYRQSILWNQFHLICTPLLHEFGRFWKKELGIRYRQSTELQFRLSIGSCWLLRSDCCHLLMLPWSIFMWFQLKLGAMLSIAGQALTWTRGWSFHEHFHQSGQIITTTLVIRTAVQQCAVAVAHRAVTTAHQPVTDRQAGKTGRYEPLLFGRPIAQIWWDSVDKRLTARQRNDVTLYAISDLLAVLSSDTK
jgi:hypothetical protein